MVKKAAYVENYVQKQQNWKEIRNKTENAFVLWEKLIKQQNRITGFLSLTQNDHMQIM